MKPAAVLAVAASLILPGVAAAQSRIVSLDQCADQYVLALADPGDIAGLSPRADDPDSFLREAGARQRRVRPTLEAVLAARPDAVVRYWGGDPRLLAALERRGVRVIQIDDAQDFPGVTTGIRSVAAALGQPGRGADLIAGMSRRLASSRDAWRGEPATYLTTAGWTSGPGTLIDAMMRAAGLTNASDGAAFGSLSIERLVLDPPRRFVLGFFDSRFADRRAVGRHPSVRRRTATRTIAALPGSMLGCPAWFTADGTQQIARAAPGR